jgi:hypothetical protein
MADRLLDGKLADQMATLYAETSSWAEVARRLLVNHGIQVSDQTLRRWAEQLGIGAAA